MIDLVERTRLALQRSGPESSDFDLNPGTVLAESRKLRPAAVLALIDASDRTLILTKRSSALKHHPGQIAFPGGKQDEDDASIIAAAMREAHEEIGLPQDAAEVLGTLPSHETVTGFVVTPVIAILTRPFDVVPERGEVDEIFHVPLDHVLNPANYTIEARMWRGQMRRYFVVPYGPYYIWGATARMLRAWTDRLTN
ncbi:MAG: CoA pyrophosphatase [Pseudomonadota bacterium]